MCLEYAKKDETKKYLRKLIKYYEKLKNSKYINFHIITYLKFLSGKNLSKKMLKEIAIFHFPLFRICVFSLTKLSFAYKILNVEKCKERKEIHGIYKNSIQ